MIGDAAATARALLDAGVRNAGVRDDALAAEIAAGSWRDEPYVDARIAGRMDPRTLSIALDALLPDERTVAVDSGHFMGFPPMYLRVPDPAGFVFTQAFQSIGLGLASGIGAAIARPDRLTVACLGDGGALMSLPELETLARLRLPMLVVIYNDAAYGAEVHHFRPHGHPVELVQFPDTDFAALASAAGARGVTVRDPDDLAAVEAWLASRDGPLDRRCEDHARLLRGMARGGLQMTQSLAEMLSAAEVVDLTQPLSEDTPVLKLPPPFANTPGLTRHVISEYDDRGPAWAWYWLEIGEHVGTHFDAPIHWVSGRDGEDVASVPAERLVGPAVVIDKSAESAADPDFCLTVDHIREFEAEHGPLPDGRLAPAEDRLGRPRARRGGVPQRQRHRPAHARLRRRVRALDRGGEPAGRRRRRDGRHRRGRRPLVRAAVPGPQLRARRGQVRPHPARQPREAPADRRGRDRGAAQARARNG